MESVVPGQVSSQTGPMMMVEVDAVTNAERWHTHDARGTLAGTADTGATIALYTAQRRAGQLARGDVHVCQCNKSEKKG